MSQKETTRAAKKAGVRDRGPKPDYYPERVADTHHFSVDPDPAFRNNADPDPQPS
jgi:hypothetical protein